MDGGKIVEGMQRESYGMQNPKTAKNDIKTP